MESVLSSLFSLDGLELLGLYMLLGLAISFLLSKVVRYKFRNDRIGSWVSYDDILIHKRVEPIFTILVFNPAEMIIQYVLFVADQIAPFFVDPIEHVKSALSTMIQLILWPASVPRSLYKMYENEIIETMINDIKRMNAQNGAVNISSIIKIHGAKRSRLLIAMKVASMDYTHRGDDYLSFHAGDHPMAESVLAEYNLPPAEKRSKNGV